jgi:hypothetical protein
MAFTALTRINCHRDGKHCGLCRWRGYRCSLYRSTLVVDHEAVARDHDPETCWLRCCRCLRAEQQKK